MSEIVRCGCGALATMVVYLRGQIRQLCDACHGRETS